MLRTAGAKPAPEIPVETLQSYAGSYKGEHGIAADITVKDGRLFATPAGQQPMSLWPLDQVTFKSVAMEGATLIFNVEDGQTVSLTLIHDGHQIELKPQKGTRDTKEI
jgi:hypothetical protein